MRSRFSLALSSLPAVAAFSLLAAGCGGGSGSPGVASVASSTSASTTPAQPGLVAYARCMRSDGVTSFPDPGGNGGIPKPQVVAAAGSNPNKFKAASTACEHLLPDGSLSAPKTAEQQRTELADELSFARCMRSHGVSNFPDPTAHGGLSVAMVEAQGIDVHSPAVLRIVQTCLPASHGGLTMQKVEESIGNNGG
jgi:hypothetical protein